jgi:hypothetical protein
LALLQALGLRSTPTARGSPSSIKKGTQSQNLVFDYTFQKPSNVTVDIITGPNAGVNLAWDGGSSVVADHGSGLAAMFKKTISLHDLLVTTLQRSWIDQLSFGAILAHGQQAAGTLSENPGETIDGVATNAVTLGVHAQSGWFRKTRQRPNERSCRIGVDIDGIGCPIRYVQQVHTFCRWVHPRRFTVGRVSSDGAVGAGCGSADRHLRPAACGQRCENEKLQSE